MGTQRKRGLLLVNYHYIRDGSQYAYPGIHPIEKHEFAEQVRELKERFHFASPEEVEAFSHGEASLCRPSVFLTFDDGLVDHAMVAREVLNPLGIKAAFFVCSRPLLELKAIMVHKVHWLRATTEPEQFVREFFDLLPADWAEVAALDQIRHEATETYVYDTPENARLKYLINFRLPTPIVDEVTSEMLYRRKFSEDEFCRDLYMQEAELRELTNAGHVVGNHGHTHTPFTRLDQDVLEREIRTSLDCLKSIIGRQPVWVSYPYGSAWAIPEDPTGFCRWFGFSIGMTLFRDWNDGTQSPYALNRINTNELRDFG